VTDFPDGSGNVPAGAISFEALKDQYFPPSNPRRWFCHYGMFVHKTTGNWGGRGEGGNGIAGNDFYVSLGGACDPPCGDIDGDGTDDTFVGTVAQQATSFMHELGHNLGLGHGGGDDINSKPNYQSVMNYDFFWGIPPGDPDGPGPLVHRLDYSREALP